MMKALTTRLGLLLAAIAPLAFAQAANAAYYVPPSNSAATQYTEAFPTAGGDQDAEAGGAHRHHSPAKVLGSRNAQKLESQGPQGQAVADIAAETAPPPPASTATTHDGGQSQSKVGSQPAKSRSGSEAQRQDSAVSGPPARGQRQTPAAEPDGSSGLGEVIGQATGASSSGGLGILLPLVLLGTVVWCVAFLSSKRRRKPAA